MLAGQNLGRRHQRGLRAGLDHGEHGEQRDHGLAAADVALEQAQHALGPREIGRDLGQGRPLRRGQPKRQGVEHGATQPAVAHDAPPLVPRLAAADQTQRHLAGEKLVIREPSARRRFGPDVVRKERAVQGAQGVRKSRPPLICEPVRILPFRQLCEPLQRFGDAAAEAALAQSLRKRIKGLERPGSGELARRRDQLGMHDLPVLAEASQYAAHDPLLAFRQDAAQVGFACLEEHQIQGYIAGPAADLVGWTGGARAEAAPARCAPMVLHLDQQGHPLALDQCGGIGL